MPVCRSRIAGSIDFRQCTGLHRTVLWQMWWLSMNISGGGIPETYEYRVKISPMLMHMEGLQNGTDSINPDELLRMPTMMGKPTGKFMAVPMQMDMLNISTGYSFSEKLFSDDSLIPACQSSLLFGVNASTASIDEPGVLYV